MTEEQYIRAHITRWDKIKTNLFILPATIFALGILYFMFFTVSHEMSRGFFWNSVVNWFTQCSTKHSRKSKNKKITGGI